MSKCDRCGKEGNDRRTIFMACLYAMEELGINFEQVNLHGQLLKKIGSKELESLHVTVPVFEEPRADVEMNSRPFYTLLVCKDCRADWLNTIRKWYFQKPSSEGQGDIPVRVKGTTKMMTAEEYEEFKKML